LSSLSGISVVFRLGISEQVGKDKEHSELEGAEENGWIVRDGFGGGLFCFDKDFHAAAACF
jgi:hypothetical protein